jgi:hypothetical protein
MTIISDSPKIDEKDLLPLLDFLEVDFPILKSCGS